jgi:hypothetical protein
MTKYMRSIVLSVGLAVLATYSQADEPMRRWTDKSGEYEVEAKLVSISSDGNTVSIELPDRQSVDVPIERLSSDDRRYLLRYKRLQSKRMASDRRRQELQQHRTVNLYGINWHQTLESAMAAGQPSKVGTDKPIMCFRVLGDLAGFM